MTTSAEEIKALPTAHFVDWLKRYAGSLRYGDPPTNGNDIAFLEVASRLSEMDAEIKRLREIESFAQTAARWSNPERRHPHTIVSADEMLKAIWGHPSRAALEHQP